MNENKEETKTDNKTRNRKCKSQQIKKKNLFRLTMISSKKSLKNNEKRRLSETPKPKHFMPLNSIKDTSRKINIKNIKKNGEEGIKNSNTNKTVIASMNKLYVEKTQNFRNINLHLKNSYRKKQEISDSKKSLEFKLEKLNKEELIKKMLKEKRAFPNYKTEEDDDTTTIPFINTFYKTNFDSFVNTTSPKNTLNKEFNGDNSMRNISYLFEKKKKFIPPEKGPVELMKPEKIAEKFVEDITQIRAILENNNFPTLSNDLFSVINEMKLSYEERIKIQKKMKNKQEKSAYDDKEKLCLFFDNFRLHGCHERNDSMKIVQWMGKMKKKYSKENSKFKSIEEYYQAFKDILAFSQRELIESERKRCKEKADLIEKLYKENVIFYEGLMEYLKLFLVQLDKNHFDDIENIHNKHSDAMAHQAFRYSLIKQEKDILEEEMEELRRLNKVLRNKLSNDVLVMKQLRSDIEYAHEREMIITLENKKILEIIKEMNQDLRITQPELPQHHKSLLDVKIKQISEVKDLSKQQLSVIMDEKSRKDVVENSRLSRSDKASYLRNMSKNSGIIELDFNTHAIAIQTDDINRHLYMNDIEIETDRVEKEEKGTQVSSIGCSNCNDLRMKLVQEEFSRKLMRSRIKKLSEMNTEMKYEVEGFKVRYELEKMKNDVNDISMVSNKLDEVIEEKEKSINRNEKLKVNGYSPVKLSLFESPSLMGSGRRSKRFSTIKGVSDAKSLTGSFLNQILQVESQEEKEIEAMLKSPETSEIELFKKLEKAEKINTKSLKILKERVNSLDIKLKMIPSDLRTAKNQEFIDTVEKCTQYIKFTKKFTANRRISTSNNPNPRVSSYLNNSVGSFFRSLTKRKKAGDKEEFTSQSITNEKIKLANTLFNEVLEDIKDLRIPKKQDMIRDITLIKQISKFYNEFSNQKRVNLKSVSYKIHIFDYLNFQNSHRKLLIKNFKQLLHSVNFHLNIPFVSIFAKFIGLAGSLPINCLEFYLDFFDCLKER